jgi:hypothetical protein
VTAEAPGEPGANSYAHHVAGRIAFSSIFSPRKPGWAKNRYDYIILMATKSHDRMKVKKVYSWIVIFSMMMLVVVCGDESVDENGRETGPQTAKLEVRLTDGPGRYQEVIVDIQDVQINPSSDSDDGWISLEVNRGKYDLLKLTNGLDTLIGSAQLPPGKISQLRLMLGEENKVTYRGRSYDLIPSSAKHSALKVDVDTLEAGKTYTILLDFDAARSVVRTGFRKFTLKPVIRASLEVTGGTSEDAEKEKGGIEGIVSPSSVKPTIYAIAGTDSVSTSTDDLGMFVIMNLDIGIYRLLVIPGDEFFPLEVDSVRVNSNEMTDAGVLILEER